MVELALARQPDLTLVGRGSLGELRELSGSLEPDVVVVGLSTASLPDECVDVLLDRPRMRMLGIEAHQGRAYLYELRPEQVEIGEVSPEDVVATIRRAARRPSLR